MNKNRQAARIVVCDDDAQIRRVIADYLAECGYSVDEADSGNGLLALLADCNPDLIILDVRMPDRDGFSVLQELRKTSSIPVMMLTAAGDVIDRVLGLEMGADDYLTKPFDIRELEARAKAAIRRGRLQTEQKLEGSRAQGSVSIGLCRLDLDGAKLFGADNQQIYLTAMEFNLLRVFVENKGRVLSREQLLRLAHDRGWEPFDRSIDLRISRIRRKVETNPEKPEVIRTVRGIGYVFG